MRNFIFAEKDRKKNWAIAGKYEILGHPILIGDVLRKIRSDSYDTCVNRKNSALELLDCFQRCGGEDKSLQQILESAEWEKAKCEFLDPSRCSDIKKQCKICSEKTRRYSEGKNPEFEILKSPLAELFAFLYKLIPAK